MSNDAAGLTAADSDPTDPATRVANARRQAQQAAAAIADATGIASHDVALVLGSGWVPAADALGAPSSEISMADIPGFSAPVVAGHAGRIRSIRVGEKNVLVLLGRTHFYEGRGVTPVVHGVRSAVAAGAQTVILTNAAGGLRDGMSVGQPILISDHLNGTATSPIIGPTFVDLTNLYSPRLRALAKEIDPTLEEGVYLQLPGPHYETPAEIRLYRTWGADLVGMSTALEAIAVREAGAEVFGLSLVTNLAAGSTGEPLDHAEVLQAGQAAATRMGTLLAELISRA